MRPLIIRDTGGNERQTTATIRPDGTTHDGSTVIAIETADGDVLRVTVMPT